MERKYKNWISGREPKDVLFTEFEFKKEYSFTLLDIGDYHFIPFKNIKYIIFKAYANEDYPKLDIERDETFYVHFSEKPFKRKWKKKFKGNLVDGHIYNANIVFERTRLDRFYIKDLDIQEVIQKEIHTPMYTDI